MRKLYLSIFSLGLLTPFAAQAQQPFERFGVKVKVLTLSNGRYPEYFANDSLRRIGSVVYNTRLKRIAYLLPEDSLAAKPRPEVTSRWVAVDPLAEKYAEISPYTYVADNPLRFIDPNGKEIVDPKGRAAYVQNKDGSYAFTKYATESVRTFVTELSKNDAGRETLAGLVAVATKVRVEVTTDRGLDHGPKEVEGHTNGRGSMTDPKTGKQVYKAADITIYTGTHEAEKAEGTGQYAQSSTGKYVNGVATHEGRHVLGDLEANKKAEQSGATGAELKNAQKAEREVIPKAQEQRANSTYPNP